MLLETCPGGVAKQDAAVAEVWLVLFEEGQHCLDISSDGVAAAGRLKTDKAGRQSER